MSGLGQGILPSWVVGILSNQPLVEHDPCGPVLGGDSLLAAAGVGFKLNLALAGCYLALLLLGAGQLVGVQGGVISACLQGRITTLFVDSRATLPGHPLAGRDLQDALENGQSLIFAPVLFQALALLQ